MLGAMGFKSTKKAELDSYKMREVAKVWYTHLKDNRLVESGPMQWEEFTETFLGYYFPRERKNVKVDEFINLKQGNINVEEYSLKFSMIS